MPAQDFIIDIVSGCNMRCASCARGNSPHIHNQPGIMGTDLMVRIVEKIKLEYNASQIHLYNWGESFLHPELPEMVKISQSLGARCFLSSNLNISHNLEEVLAADPYCLRVTVSGFTQPVYGRNHVGGNIDLVKDNLARLSSVIRNRKLHTQIHVYYLRFKYNLHEEKAMQVYARKLGFGFHPVWALLIPVEKALAFADPNAGEPALSESDRQVINDLALPLEQTLQACRNYNIPCPLRNGQIVLDALGNVLLCCSVYDSSRFTIAPFLSSRPKDIWGLKEKHPFCSKCMQHGIHVYETRGAQECDEIASRNIDPRFAQSFLFRWERFQKTVFYNVIPDRLRQHAYNLYARMVKY